MDLLKATYELFGDCKMVKNVIYIGNIAVTPEQLVQITDKATTNKVVDDNVKLVKELNKALLEVLDTQCVSLGFTGDDKTRPYRAIANYVGYTNEYRADAESLGAWIATVFKHAEVVQTDVAGGATAPTVTEFIAGLPVYGA